jgi:hypothetical protein
MQYILTNIDYWEKALLYWKEEKENARVGSTYYGNCCVRIGILEDIFKCLDPIKQKPQKKPYKMSPINWLVKKIRSYGIDTSFLNNSIKTDSEMRKRELETLFTEKQVIDIVRKTKETGLTAEYFILLHKTKQKFKK